MNKDKGGTELREFTTNNTAPVGNGLQMPFTAQEG